MTEQCATHQAYIRCPITSEAVKTGILSSTGSQNYCLVASTEFDESQVLKV